MAYKKDRRWRFGASEAGHKAIYKYLTKQGFIDYIKNCDSNNLDGDIDKVYLEPFFKATYGAFNCTQGSLAQKVRKGWKHPHVNRATKALNGILRDFCIDRVDPPIQLFFSAYDPMADTVRKVKCHFACSKIHIVSAGNKDHVCSTIIKPLEQAIIDIDPKLDKFRLCLKNDALNNLISKLHGKQRNDYEHLSLEIGIFDKGYKPPQNDDITAHNRQWRNFREEKIFCLNEKYVLSSDTGRGKTTFLRHLQLKLLEENTSMIPLYLEANKLKAIFDQRDTVEGVLEQVGQFYTGYLNGNDEGKFLNEYRSHLFFLIDGLDQIDAHGTAYVNLTEKIFGIFSNRVIIASRPSAVSHLEQDQRVSFLRLKPFGLESIKEYFGDDYQAAKELCKNCLEMLTIPMLAYMVRTLIVNKQTQGIQNRADLYKRFINYLFDHKQYIHDNLNVKRSFRRKIRQAYEKISFDAIAGTPCYLQQIPFKTADDAVNDIDIDDLLKFGIAHIFESNTSEDDDILHFTHQSFQEYLAAKHCSEDDESFALVLREKWNSKWKEVIRFLVGIRKQEVIREILAEDDNIIYSNLFLAAELCVETNVDSDLGNEIKIRLENVPDAPRYLYGTTKSYILIDPAQGIEKLFEIIKQKKRLTEKTPYDLLRSIAFLLPNTVSQILVMKLKNGIEPPIVTLQMLNALCPTLNEQDAIAISEMIDHDDRNVAWQAIEIIAKMKHIAPDLVTEKAIKGLEFLIGKSEESVYPYDVYHIFSEDFDDDSICRIADNLTKAPVSAIISTLIFLEVFDGALPDKAVDKVYEVIKLKNHEIEKLALKIISKANVADQRLETVLSEKLNSDHEPVFLAALKALKIANNISSKMVSNIIARLSAADSTLRHSILKTLVAIYPKLEQKAQSAIFQELYHIGKDMTIKPLWLFEHMLNQITGKTISEISNQLTNASGKEIIDTLKFIGTLDNFNNNTITNLVFEKLADQNENVVKAAMFAAVNYGEINNSKYASKITQLLADEKYKMTALVNLADCKFDLCDEIIEQVSCCLDDDDLGIKKLALNIFTEEKRIMRRCDTVYPQRINTEIANKIQDIVLNMPATNAIYYINIMPENLKSVLVDNVINSFEDLHPRTQDGILSFLQNHRKYITDNSISKVSHFTHLKIGSLLNSLYHDGRSIPINNAQ